MAMQSRTNFKKLKPKPHIYSPYARRDWPIIKMFVVIAIPSQFQPIILLNNCSIIVNWTDAYVSQGECSP